MEKKKFSETGLGKFLQKAVSVLPDALEVVAVASTNPAQGLQLLSDKIKRADPDQVEDLELEFISKRHEWEMELNRWKLEVYRAENEDRRRATENYKLTKDITDDLAFEIMGKNLWYIGGLVFLNVLVVIFAEKIGMDVALVAVASNFIGIVIKALLDERNTVVGFFMGSSMGDKEKGKNLQESVNGLVR